ncbi:MAG: DUF3443 domain-containing protein [Acidobacteriota bacterium]
MKSGRILLLSMVLVIIGNAFAITAGYADLSIPVPTGQQNFSAYGPIASPVISAEPLQAMPIGLGSVASGGDTMSIQVGIATFSGPVDIYFGFLAPSMDPQNIYLLTSNDTLMPLSVSDPLRVKPVPWIINASGGANELFGNIPVSSLPAGRYTFFLLVTPAGSLGSYYLWTTAVEVADNILPITVNGALCSADSYLNKPCVNVTVCTPGTSDCQTISDILLDTGSYGLRIFSQVLTVSLPQVAIGSGSLAECIQFGDGSSEWGPVKTASVILGNEPAVQIPIHVIDSTFGSLPRACLNAEQSPSVAGFNGMLGVGLFIQDCGAACANSAQNGMYYACTGTQCGGTAVDLSTQVQNPVAFLPEDNNGVIVHLPSVPPGGVPSVNGSLVLGIGTQFNNTPSGVTTYPADQSGEFTTTFNGILYNSFIDTGSNGLFFPSPSASVLPECTSPNSDWFCPSSTIGFSAINTGASGSPSGMASFLIGNLVSLTSSSNNVFSEIGGNSLGDFEWGLPFLFGRNISVGLEKSSSVLGTGPYWAY